MNSSGSTLRRAGRVHARRAPGEDQRRGLAGEDLGDGGVAGHDLGVDLRLPHPAGDQLGVLRPVVDDEDGGRLHPAQGSQYLARVCAPGHIPCSSPAAGGYQPACARSPAPTVPRSSPSMPPAAWSATPTSDTPAPTARCGCCTTGGPEAAWSAAPTADIAACNWLTTPDRPLCDCCPLTRTRPARRRHRRAAAFARTEAAKRRLVYQLDDLGLPIVAGRRPRGRPGLRPAVQRARDR